MEDEVGIMLILLLQPGPRASCSIIPSFRAQALRQRMQNTRRLTAIIDIQFMYPMVVSQCLGILSLREC